MTFKMEAHAVIFFFCLTLSLTHLGNTSTYTRLSVSNMTELYLNYPTTEDYPTAMYYSAQYGTALLTTDTDVGASVFYFQPSRVTDMGNFANSLTHLGGKADVDGYIASEPDNSTFTHIYSTSLLGGSTMILAEKNCIRRINFNQAEDEANRIGVCEDGNFTDEGFGSDMRLQDIKRVVLDPDNMLYVLCGSQGNGTGGLMLLNLDNSTSRILALHDDIALSDEFSSGTPDVKDMAVDSSFSTLYVLVNNGGLVAYDITDISDTGYIQPVYRISQSGGDPGANFTMNNVIYDNATIIVRPYDRQLLIQNYGNSEPSENKLVALDLDMVSNLNSSQSIPRHAVSTLCAGGDNFMPGSSMNCTVNADLMLRPVMDIDNATGFLMMAITSSTNISFFIYEFEESEEEIPETTTPELTTTTTTTAQPTTTTTTTTQQPTTTTTTTQQPTTTTTTEQPTTNTTNFTSTATVSKEANITGATNSSSTSLPPLNETSSTFTIPTDSPATVTDSIPGRPDDGDSNSDSNPPDKISEFQCLYCLPGECENENTTYTKNCTHGCYSRSQRLVNGSSKSIEIIKGCAEDVFASPDELECSDITLEGSCRYYRLNDIEVEYCVRCCTKSSCNKWMKHLYHSPSRSNSLNCSMTSLVTCISVFLFLRKISLHGVI